MPGKTIHGLSHTKLYNIWQLMKGRCYNPSNQDYNNYGGRGIYVCEEWKEKPVAFYEWAMSNGYKDGLTIERVNFNEGYTPANCTWIPMSEQGKNTRRVNKVTLFGETKSIHEWVKDDRIKIGEPMVYRRMKKGLSAEQALLTPSKKAKYYE